MELLVEDGRVAGVGRITAMQDACNHALGGVDRNTSPFAKLVHLSALDIQIINGGSESTGIISIPQAACIELVLEV